jgi:transcriptional regulator with PAS, ATPase and Fis domain
MTLSQYLEKQEKQFVSDCLIRNKYNISKSAKELGIERATLYYKLKTLDISIPDRRKSKVNYI